VTLAQYPVTQPNEIALRDVSVAYQTGRADSKTVLSRLNLDIASGEFVAVLGETGCGKSTLLRLILGQEFPTSGTVTVAGRPVDRIDARCGYVPQKYSLFPDRTSLGNVVFGPENMHSRGIARIRPSFRAYRRSLRAEAELFLARMGLRAQDMGKYPHQLSGGMQQRVAIAQALLMKPAVLLMDEAFSALDPSTRSALQRQLHDVWRESRPTVVFVTHNTSEALLLGTRLIVLGRHWDDRPGESNLLLNAEVPACDLPSADRKHDRCFLEFRDEVKQFMHRASSLQCTVAEPDDNE
jgi:NitT/TauT family transport system ATP-binding protein